MLCICVDFDGGSKQILLIYHFFRHCFPNQPVKLMVLNSLFNLFIMKTATILHIWCAGLQYQEDIILTFVDIDDYLK